MSTGLLSRVLNEYNTKSFQLDTQGVTHHQQVTILVTQSVDVLNAWLHDYFPEGRIGYCGLDVEWKPVVNKGDHSPVALVQLAHSNSVLLFQIHRCATLQSLEPSDYARFFRDLARLLSSRSYLKVGVGVAEDGCRLDDDWNLPISRWLDLADMAHSLGLDPRSGLGALAEHFLHVTLAKPKKIQCSNWEADPLSWRQIQYAAADAWMGVKLFETMLDRFVDTVYRRRPELRLGVAEWLSQGVSVETTDSVELEAEQAARVKYARKHRPTGNGDEPLYGERKFPPMSERAPSRGRGRVRGRGRGRGGRDIEPARWMPDRGESSLDRIWLPALDDVQF